MINIPQGPFSIRYDEDSDSYWLQNHEGTMARVRFEWGGITGDPKTLANLIASLLNQHQSDLEKQRAEGKIV